MNPVTEQFLSEQFRRIVEQAAKHPSTDMHERFRSEAEPGNAPGD